MTRFTTLALAVGFSVAAAGTAVAIETVPGMPPVVDPANLYSETMADKLSPAVAKALPRVYVPNLKSNDVTVIDPATLKVVDRFPVGVNPQHVVPSWDLTTLWVTNNAEHRTDGTLTPIDPVTGKPGRPVAVDDPYNMYFTPDGRSAIVVAEALKRLDFRDPKTMTLQGSLAAPDCAGINHGDFSIDGRYLIMTCEYAGRLVKIDWRGWKVLDISSSREAASRRIFESAPTGRSSMLQNFARAVSISSTAPHSRRPGSSRRASARTGSTRAATGPSST